MKGWFRFWRHRMGLELRMGLSNNHLRDALSRMVTKRVAFGELTQILRT